MLTKEQRDIINKKRSGTPGASGSDANVVPKKPRKVKTLALNK
jgi:hypothetical protein